MMEQNGGGRSGKRIVVLVLLVALVGGVAGYLRSRKEASVAGAPAASAPVAASTAVVIDVTTAAVVTRQLERSLEAVGSLAADEEVVVAAQAPGELAQLSVDFGSYVTAGQVIAQIDQRDAKLRVEQAEAALRQTMARLGMKEGEKFEAGMNAEVKVAQSSLDWATLDLERAARLIEKGDVARSVYDQSRINRSLAQARYQAAVDAVNQQLAIVEQQRAAISLARKSVTDTVVRAPITGAVKEKFATRGSYLSVGGRILSLVKINPLRLRAEIPEYAAATVRTGQSITLRVESFPDRTFSGRVVRIGPSLSEQTRALTVEAEVANPGIQLRPGMFARAQLVLAKSAPALMVPRKALVTVAGLEKLFVIEGGRAVERVVRTGASDGELIEVTEGVREGEVVATSNTDKLQQSAAVRAAN